MEDKKFYTSKEDYELFKQGYPAMAIEAESYYSLIKNHGPEMIGLNVLIKIRPKHDKGKFNSIFGRLVIDGWHNIQRC